MARNNYGSEKRQRELKKERKKEGKRQRKLDRRNELQDASATGRTGEEPDEDRNAESRFGADRP